MNILFKKIKIIEPINNLDFISDLHIVDGYIKSISDNCEPEDNTEVIYSEGWICSPGLYDMHVHFREPGQEYKEDILSGCESAANGGFTGVCCMPNTEPSIDNATVVEFIKQKSKGLLTDVHVAGTLTKNREGKSISPMLELIQYGVVMFTDDGSCVMNSEVMKRCFNYLANHEIVISQHCEDHNLTENFSMNESVVSSKLGLKGYPNIAEDVIIARDIMIAEYCGNHPYHVSHISSKGGLILVKKAKERGLNVTCEVTPHHFSISDKAIEKFDTNYKMNPPLREMSDIEAILQAISDDTIDCIASDHAPHALHEKDVEFEKAPNGIIGLETSLGLSLTKLVHTNLITVNKLIEKMSVNPRKILRLKNIIIKEGEKANLTIFNPEEEWIVDKNLFKSKSKNTPFHGMKLKGKPKFTINNHKIYKSIL